MSVIVDNLRTLMKRNGISAYRIERDTKKDIKQSTVSRILSENREPRPSTVKKLADYFGVTVSQLIGEEPLPESDVMSEYPAGPCPRGFDPEIWREVPARVDETLAEFLYEEFPGTYVRDQAITEEDSQVILQVLYYLWVRKRRAGKERSDEE